METSTKTPDNIVTHKDVYTIINEKIIEQLEKGTAPWRNPWHTAGLPKNLITDRQYRGINLILLASMGYEQNYFLTYKQLTELGGSVKKDEKGHMVAFWNFPDREAENTDAIEEVQEPRKRATLRYYTVFNIAQCENIPADKLPVLQEREFNPISACERIVAGMPQCPVIKHKEASAYYNPLQDYVNMPRQKSFESEEAYYSTLFHELVHSTGHHSRLARKDLIEMAEFGSDAYSHEEFVAEIGTCYFQSFTGIESRFEQSAAYIKGWLWKLKNDKRFIFSASAQAQKAADYILNVQSDAEESKEE
ncbi:MAG: hypothetical protein BGO70_01130 [Bacteroidetes bacterium 43-93]|uniref:ArdC family protein n=1 Tax=uncultured Dysgonomonas sp. TaxID=206096 RepID=UPI000927D720|nr:zincin-like metallopeptidase domain-containing protein [uncultured Dysgonomonas sp.]MBN9483120.1 DUF1738 domain-containing protein [Bacteroidota bacterium]OJW96315.1 MAG: hypothetical protein BGO70_01130 [Bacteroidetes bacterium 43-93]